jgi:molybdate transport system ATP-binding protein
MININITKELHGADGVMQLAFHAEIQEGEFVALSGKSGSGKTTLLRILAGLEEAQGDIIVSKKEWLHAGKALPPQQREIGFVFQEYALFDNMTIEENLLFVAKDRELAEKLLEMTELTKMKRRYPHALSGGQKQRVSICRALMKRPKILLLDEPLSALDVTMRTKLQQELLQLHKEFKTTTIMVSHDPSEIYRLASRVIELENGTIINNGKTKDILLKTKGSQKFSFEGELLEIKRVDVIFIAIVAIGQQLVEVVLSKKEAEKFKVGQRVTLSTKAFSPTLS